MASIPVVPVHPDLAVRRFVRLLNHLEAVYVDARLIAGAPDVEIGLSGERRRFTHAPVGPHLVVDVEHGPILLEAAVAGVYLAKGEHDVVPALLGQDGLRGGAGDPLLARAVAEAQPAAHVEEGGIGVSPKATALHPGVVSAPVAAQDALGVVGVGRQDIRPDPCGHGELALSQVQAGRAGYAEVLIAGERNSVLAVDAAGAAGTRRATAPRRVAEARDVLGWPGQ